LWGKGLPGKAQWRRGFPEVFRVRAGQYMRRTKALERLAPVQSIKLYERNDWENDSAFDEGHVLQLMKCELQERWTELEIEPGFFGLDDSEEFFEALMASPHLTGLRRLSVRDNECLGNLVCGVADPKFAHLTHLDVNNSRNGRGGPTDEGIVRLVSSPHLARLQHLDIGGCDVGDDGLCALAAAPCMTGLKTLNVEGGNLTGPGIRALSAPGSLPSLTFLNLSGSLAERTDMAAGHQNSIADVIDAALLARLSGLDLSHNGLEDADLARLAARSDISGLRFLGIGSHRLSATGVQALLSSPALPHLSHLGWSGQELTDEIASVLLAAPQLTRLTVSCWGIPNKKTMSRLRKRFTVLFGTD
jgi:hypothetical protein